MSATQPDDAIGANRELWDAWTRIHRDSAFYDVPGFLAGHDPLNRIETEELGDVVRWPYLATGEPIEIASEASYVGPIEDGPLPEYNWPHGIGDVVNVLVGAGLRIEWLREHARSPYPSRTSWSSAPRATTVGPGVATTSR